MSTEDESRNSPAARSGAGPDWVGDHERAPNATFVRLLLPVVFSLLAEPVTGLVDTAFVAAHGAESLAALGVGVTTLSGVFWAFNFLNIGTQTEVARALGRGQRTEAAAALRQAVWLAVGLGILVGLVGWLVAPVLARWMGAEGEVHAAATLYFRIRLLAAPALLVMVSCFGALRGAAAMRAPLVVAVGLNSLNIALDAWWIPSLGVQGAAWATAVSHWAGAIAALWLALRSVGWSSEHPAGAIGRFAAIGADLFLRTLTLNFFLVATTAVATRIGAEEASAHHAARMGYVFGAFLLDAYAAVAQTQIAHFLGAGAPGEARRVALRSCVWGVATGVAFGAAMIALEGLAYDTLAAEGTALAFATAWGIAALFQPMNALSFVTDGIHWGTGEFAYLRRGMFVATGVAVFGLWTIDPVSPGALARVWWWGGAWSTLRAVWGIARVWPGATDAPLGRSGAMAR